MRKFWMPTLLMALFLGSCQREGTETIPVPVAEKGNFDFKTERSIAVDIQFETHGLNLQPMLGTPVDVEILVDGRRLQVGRAFVKAQGVTLDVRVPSFTKHAWLISPLTKAELAFELDHAKKSISFEIYQSAMGIHARKQVSEEGMYLHMAGMRPEGGSNSRDFDRDGVDDDFDEFPQDPARAFTMMEPAWGYNTYAFEDLWPSQGDYDFNDLVLDHRIRWVFNGKQERVEAAGELVVRAQGAGLPNGLAMQLLEFTPETQSYQSLPAGLLGNLGGHLSQDPSGAANTAIVSNHLSASLKSYYTNLNDVGPNRIPDTLRYQFSLTQPSAAFVRTDFFLLRGDAATGQADRSMEIHVCGRPATSAANTEYFGTFADKSGNGSWYKDQNSMPWAMEIFAAPLQLGPNNAVTGHNVGTWTPFAYPKSKVRIDIAYPGFGTWARSNGRSADTWMTQSLSDKIWIPDWQR